MKISPALKPLATKTRSLPCRRIMVPVDFSPLSESAMWQAVEFAQANGASLLLFHAVEPLIHSLEFAIVPPEMDEINLTELEACKRKLAPVRHNIQDATGIKCRLLVRLGKPWKAIVDAARNEKIDLIIMPTHGRTGLTHTVLGSTAEKVVQHAPCSVLILRSASKAARHAGRKRSARL